MQMHNIRKFDKLRKCLNCNREFKSSGPGNRRCPLCKQAEPSLGIRHSRIIARHMKDPS